MRRAPHRRTAPVLAAALGALVLAACGGSSASNTTSSADVAKVKATVTRLLAAIASGDGQTACSLATPAGRAQLQKAVPGASCEQIIALVATRLPAKVKTGLRQAQVKRVTIKGDTATVKDSDITSPQGNVAGFLQTGGTPTTLNKQPDGSWKVAG